MENKQSYPARVLSRAWAMTLAGFRLKLESTLVALLWLCGVIGVLWFFGADQLLESRLGFVGASALVFVVLFAVIFLANIPRAAAAIQKEVDDEIAALRKQLDDREARQAAIDSLWQLRKAGVELRNEPVASEAVLPAWNSRALAWHSQVLNEATKANPNLRG